MTRPLDIPERQVRKSIVLVVGSAGRIGSVLMRGLADEYCLHGCDVATGWDVMETKKLYGYDAVVLLAGRAEPRAEFQAYEPALRIAEHVISLGVPVVFASSVWADQRPLNAYGVVKLAIERMVDQAGGRSIRLGWVGWTPDGLRNADPWRQSVAWKNERVIAEFRAALEAICDPRS